MTDTETIKALECCVSYEYTCLNCPYCEEKHYTEENGFKLMPNGKYYDDLSCDEWLKRDVFDLVNRQKAEKENLEIEIQAMRNAANGYKAEVERLRAECGNQSNLWSKHYESIFETAKAEAVKEFAERLKKRMGFCDLPNGIVRSHIDNLLKETVGDADDK